MSVAKPWMLPSRPRKCPIRWPGFPFFEFSQAIALAAGGLHAANGSEDWAALAEFTAITSWQIEYGNRICVGRVWSGGPGAATVRRTHDSSGQG